jgi:AraC family transcriptional regulator of adaptative response / DNA-3-methyladenine glycosylase II
MAQRVTTVLMVPPLALCARRDRGSANRTLAPDEVEKSPFEDADVSTFESENGERMRGHRDNLGSVALDTRACNRARLARDPRFDGRFFIAVLSTGIYCRPICPSPTARRANVRFYRYAEEAIAAGFRACLRCRPETLPGTPAWHGTSATVSRALRLIAEGALLEHSVHELSRRLGVSARHLHRLFVSHLGTSPMAVMQTSRVNFAGDLIRGTDLPMSLVAQAAGFGSVRRFNDSFRRLYGRTPTSLRRARSTAGRSREDEYVFRISYRPPFDWDWALSFLAARAIPGVEEVAGAAYRRSFEHENRHGILEVRHDEDARSLEVRIRFAEPLSLLPIVTRVRGMFDVLTDTAVIARHLGRDTLLAPFVRRYPSPRVPGAWDGFELAVRAILGQQVSVAGASTLAGRVARQFGEPLASSDFPGLTVLFPTPRALADAHLTGMPQSRSRAIRTLAREVVSGRLTFAGSAESAAAGLVRIPGVGDWTAQYVAMRALREPDAFPAGDLVLRRVAGGGRPLTAESLRARAERWRPWRAYAAITLWRAASDMAREDRSDGGPAWDSATDEARSGSR